jgi:predicted ATPase
MKGKRLFQSLRLENFLSYGSNGVGIELLPLNVLIGLNGTGKSNLIEALALLRAAPLDLAAPTRSGGGVAEWIWKGEGSDGIAKIETLLESPQREHRALDSTGHLMPIRYRLHFRESGYRFEVVDEALENAEPVTKSEKDVFFFYRIVNDVPYLSYKGEDQPRRLPREDVSPEKSILSQRKDPDKLPELTFVGDIFSEITIYRDFGQGRHAKPPLQRQADLPADFLLPDASNLGLVLNQLPYKSQQSIINKMGAFLPTIDDIDIKIINGNVQLFVHEKGFDQLTPATRLSDGTVHYLCLLAILCHPSPPSLICIEEPEIGLHPNAALEMGELLIEASERTQLIVTTHSDTLISSLTDAPESVVVCERDEDGTNLRRLRAEQIRPWLDKYMLGDLWRGGHFGGDMWLAGFPGEAQ